MKFKKSKEYPSGAVVCTTDELEKLEAKGWTVNMHTPGYANFIGVETNGLSLGFGAWMTNLEADISTPEVGYYNDSWSGPVKFKSQKELNAFIKLIDSALVFKKAQE